ncbi:putative efflux pump antibiotic resistance protein [Hypoxylon rubiginosum]|uniref:Efflux pump antibiotic resistance protein n=1 Tax=Hypoxylon rubiginosum TaxID=110542 RepID=A0ACC0CUS7_9PEZI|nr:putative efflux pump antibiotic resistance protein [Hypoxylon rubiginosum]
MQGAPDDIVVFNHGAKRSLRFWAIMVSLMITGLMSSIEGTIITSALPTITRALGGGNLYIWVPNAFFLSFIATLPLFAQVSDIFGRRWPFIIAVALFVLGSGICGGSVNMGMLIAGRTVQGVGGGGIQLLTETIITDLVPLRERGLYIALTMVAATVGAALGPFVGGLIADLTTWRWVFCLNLPIGGVAFVLLFVFLRVKSLRDDTWKQRLLSIDLIGNCIFIAAVIAVLIALTWGGTVYAWNTYHIIVPLVLGFLGFGLFLAYEWTICKKPSFPLQVLSNRTSAAAFMLTLIHSLCTYWAFYFLPLYFQAIKGLSSFNSGIDTLPIFAGIIPFAMIGGGILSKWGHYKPVHLVGWAIITISYGLFSLMDQNSSTAAWVCFQLLLAAGSGLLAGILLPAMQAPLDESLMALTIGIWAFARGFGSVWGVAIPSAVFNNECRLHADDTIKDPQLAQYLSGGHAYEYATQAFLDSIESPTSREQVVQVFSQSLRIVWLIGVAFGGVGFLITFLEKEVQLRDKLETKYGLEEKKNEETKT